MAQRGGGHKSVSPIASCSPTISAPLCFSLLGRSLAQRSSVLRERAAGVLRVSPTAECPTAQPLALWNCRALLDSPPAPLLQQNFSPERRLAGTRAAAAAAVLLLHAPSGSAATGRSLQPAALLLASTEPRPHAAGAAGPPGHPWGIPGALRPCCAARGRFWPQGLGGRKCGLR